MTALYFVANQHGRSQCPTLDDAYRLAWSLLQSGASFVDIVQHKLTSDCWGPATGEDGLLHHLAPGEYPVAPTGGHGSTGTFPPYVWRFLTTAAPAPAPAPVAAWTDPALGEPWPDEPPAAAPPPPPAPVAAPVVEAVQGTLFG